MRTRKQLINDLIDASDFKDSEIVLNSSFIRDLFNDAVGHLKDATKIAAENKRHRENIKLLKAKNTELSGKIRRLQAERDAALADFKLYRERNIKGECGVYACDLCKRGGRYEDWDENKCPTGCTGVSHWEWRGVQKEG